MMKKISDKPHFIIWICYTYCWRRTYVGGGGGYFFPLFIRWPPPPTLSSLTLFWESQIQNMLDIIFCIPGLYNVSDLNTHENKQRRVRDWKMGWGGATKTFQKGKNTLIFFLLCTHFFLLIPFPPAKRELKHWQTKTFFHERYVSDKKLWRFLKETPSLTIYFKARMNVCPYIRPLW